ncbi:MAG TPA: hypothetical protein VFY25_11500, partial [Anaerolineales bacterium]|nr:hypothetical protein [Anaerolineales bacterium]
PSFDLWYTDFADCTELFRHFKDALRTVVSVASVYKTGIFSTFLEKTIHLFPLDRRGPGAVAHVQLKPAQNSTIRLPF